MIGMTDRGSDISVWRPHNYITLWAANTCYSRVYTGAAVTEPLGQRQITLTSSTLRQRESYVVFPAECLPLFILFPQSPRTQTTEESKTRVSKKTVAIHV